MRATGPLTQGPMLNGCSLDLSVAAGLPRLRLGWEEALLARVGHRSVVSFLSVLALLGASLLMLTGPATADTGWDPDDQRGPLDLRWAGAYRESADTVRVGIRLWDPVFRGDIGPKHTLMLSMNPHQRDADGFVIPRKGGGWVARFYDDGYPSPLFRARVAHPSGTLFRLWLPAYWAKGEPIAVVTTDLSGGHSRWDQINLVAP